MDKAPGAFRTISEVADEIDVPQHVLRFWESRFTQIRPMKRGGGRRFYRPEDVDLLRGVRHLLYGEGYTIRGVQRILREQGPAFVQSIWHASAELPVPDTDGGEEDDMPAAPAPERSEPDLSVFAAPPRRYADSATVDRDDRGKLRAALDELVACNRLLEAALAGLDTAEQSGSNAARRRS